MSVEAVQCLGRLSDLGPQQFRSWKYIEAVSRDYFLKTLESYLKLSINEHLFVMMFRTLNTINTDLMNSTSWQMPRDCCIFKRTQPFRTKSSRQFMFPRLRSCLMHKKQIYQSIDRIVLGKVAVYNGDLWSQRASQRVRTSAHMRTCDASSPSQGQHERVILARVMGLWELWNIRVITVG